MDVDREEPRICVTTKGIKMSEANDGIHCSEAEGFGVMPMATVKLLDAAKRVISLHDRQLLTCVPHDSTAIESLRVAVEEFREMLQHEGTKPSTADIVDEHVNERLKNE